MGFFDSFKETYARKNQQLEKDSKRENYKTVEERVAMRNKALLGKSDEKLLRMWKEEDLSVDEYYEIEGILHARGYRLEGDVWNKY